MLLGYDALVQLINYIAVADPSSGLDLSAALTGLFIVLLAAKIGDEIFERLKQPVIIGEILAGVLIGPAVFGLVQPDAAFKLFSELGVVFLLFWVGLKTRLSDMLEVGLVATKVGIFGALLPFIGGFGLGAAMGKPVAVSLFLAVGLMATSVGITSAVLVSLGSADGPASRTILGAAVIDDIIALTLLSVAVGLSSEGGISLSSIAVTLAFALGFVVLSGLFVTRFFQRRPEILDKPRFDNSQLLSAVIICLGLAALAAKLGLATVIGAFLAGMIVAETKEAHPVELEIKPLYALFPPFFFAYVGAQLPLSLLADGKTLALLAAVAVLAIITKAVGAWLGSRQLSPTERKIVAVGMVPRGEVGIIVAGIGRASGVIDGQLFAVIVGMSVLTTLLVPPILQRLINNNKQVVVA